MRARQTGRLIWGLLFIVLGVLFLLDVTSVIDLRAAYVVPIVVIALGLGLVLGAAGAREP